MNQKKLFLFVLSCLTMCWAQAAVSDFNILNVDNRIYVNASSPGSANGTGNSWTEANSSLADALEYARTNTDIKEIWVAKGEYTPKYNPVDNSLASASGLRDATFCPPTGVKIYGGFSGTDDDETIDDRDVKNNTTTLSGYHSSSYSSYHVVLLVYNDVTLDGFTVTKGNTSTSTTITVNGKSIGRDLGIGIHMNNVTGITLNNLNITSNTRSTSLNSGGGGGIYAIDSEFTLTNSTVSSNTAYMGAGIYVTGTFSVFTMSHCIVSSNSASTTMTFSTGGIHFEGTTATAKNSLIFGNSGQSNNMDFYAKNATINFYNVTVETTTYRSTFILTSSTLNLWNSVIATNSGSSDAFSAYLSSNCTINGYNSYLHGYSIGTTIPASGKIIIMDENCVNHTSYNNLFNNYPIYFDHRLKPCSPLVNAGNNTYAATYTTDLDGNNRIVDDLVDIGAYELQNTTILPQHVLEYDNENDRYDKLLLDQHAVQGSPIQDVLFYYEGATGIAETEWSNLPQGVSIEFGDAVDGRIPFRITGTPTEYGVFNYYLITEGPTDACTMNREIYGRITIGPDVTPDEDGILYVKKGATGKGNSWDDDDALGNLAIAVLGAQYNNDVKQIWVGPGTYIPQFKISEYDYQGDDTTDEDKTFLVVNGVKLYGGFDPENSITNLSHDRDSTLTVLSGYLGEDENSQPIHAYHVVVALNEEPRNSNGDLNHIVVDGFTITGGNANGMGFVEDEYGYKIERHRGGGIYSQAGSGYITINGNYIYENAVSGNSGQPNDSDTHPAGGGIYACGFQQIVNNRIENNTANGDWSKGAGITVSFNGRSIINSPALRASASEGMPVSNIYIAHNLIDNNSAYGAYTSGGGISLLLDGYYFNEEDWKNSSNCLQILYNTVTNNKIGVGSSSNYSVGGGISYGGAMEPPQSPALKTSTIDRSADDNYNRDIVIGYNWIAGNSTVGSGGGVGLIEYVYSVLLVNNVIVENEATANGGGVFAEYATDPVLLNNTVWNNEASVSGDGYYAKSRTYIYNTIVDEVYLGSYSSAMANSLYKSFINNDNNASLSDNIQYTTGDLLVEGDGTNRYSILGTSDAVNGGNNEYWYWDEDEGTGYVDPGLYDFAGDDRVFDKTIDIGAYEALICPTTDEVTINGVTVTVVPDTKRIVYVKDYSSYGAEGLGGSISGDGSSWEDAHESLADVLLYANAYPACIKEIWVAQGTHLPKYDAFGFIPDEGEGNDLRGVTFRLADGVHVYGGFPANATSTNNNDKDNINHRNWNAYETILSGDIEGDDDCESQTTKVDNAYHVIVAAFLTATTELNGFVVTGGYADNDGSVTFSYTTNNDGPEEYNLFKSAGGGIAVVNHLKNRDNTDNSLYVKNTRVTQNHAIGGGGMYSDGAYPVFVNVLIDNNEAVMGGGVYVSNTQELPTSPALPTGDSPQLRSAISNTIPTFTNVTIADNQVVDLLLNPDPLTAQGGGLYMTDAKISLLNTIIWGNTTNVRTVSGITNGGNANYIDYSHNCIIEGVGDSFENTNVIYDKDPLFIKNNEEVECVNIINTTDYRLQSSSPAINEGDNYSYYSAVGGKDRYLSDERELGAVSRIIEGKIDMGAYEASHCPFDGIIENGIVYVKDFSVDGVTGNDGNGSGSDWDNAIGDLAYVLHVARAYPGCIKEIHIAEGSYYPGYDATTNDNEDYDDEKNWAFVIPDDILIYGSYPADASTDKTTMADRDTRNTPTVLDAAAANVDYYHAVIIPGTGGVAPVLDGLLITGAHALCNSGDGYDCEVNVEGIVVDHNVGAGVYVADNVVIKNSSILNNSARDGGGIADSGNREIIIELINVVIAQNAAIGEYGNGGGICNNGATYYLTNVTIADNRANYLGGGIYGSTNMVNTIIWNNGDDYEYNYSTGNMANATQSQIENSLIGGANLGSDASPRWDSDFGTGWGVNATPTKFYDFDPDFVDPWANSDYTLSPYSEAIDQGLNNLYLTSANRIEERVGNDVEYDEIPTDKSDTYANDGYFNTRLMYEAIDLGAIESQFICSPTMYVKDYAFNEEEALETSTPGDGSSWEKAHPSLADVLYYASIYPGCVEEIWVAEGTYLPKYDLFGNEDPKDERDKTFMMENGINIYGGFPASATTETNYDKNNIIQRNWNKWETLLSGDLAQDDKEETGSKADNVYHVIAAIELTEVTELNGFVIVGGYADLNEEGAESEYVTYYYDETFPNNAFQIYRNSGGGITNYSSSENRCNSFYVKNTIITDNYTGSNGGGVYINPFANPYFVNTLIDNNEADLHGGGIYNDVEDPQSPMLRIAVSSCIDGDNAKTTLVNVTIADNKAGGEGGGFYDKTNNAHIYNTIIWGNKVVDNDSGSENSGLKGSIYSVFNSIIQGFAGINNDPKFIGSGGDKPYSLSSESEFAIDLGVDNYYYNAVGGEEGYLDDERDLGAGLRIFGTAIDMGAYEFTPCPPIVIWLGLTADWHDPSNWYPALVPQSCTDVYIPGVAVVEDQSAYVFPVLSGSAGDGNAHNTCNDIYFMPGAQLGQPQLLNYRYANVEINYNKNKSNYDPATITYEAFVEIGKDNIDSEAQVALGATYSNTTMSRGIWNMFSAPLKEITTGDFAFGGFPFSFINQYDAVNGTDSYIMGTWAELSNDSQSEFAPGQGFGHLYNHYVAGRPYGMDSNAQWSTLSSTTADTPKHIKAKTDSDDTTPFGLKHSNGILHFPFYADSYLSDARREHVFEPSTESGATDKDGTSTFHFYFRDLITSPVLLQWDGITEEVERSTDSHRFIFEGWDGKYTPAGTFTGGNIILVGNPYMSALDFDAFQEANETKIKHVYQIYTSGGEYAIYGTDVTGGNSTDKYIAPMQSFLVEVANEHEGELELVFNPATMALTNTSTVLKASRSSENHLTITASNANGSVSAWLRQSDNADDAFCNDDFSKIIDSPNTLPQVYTLTETDEGKQRALVMNTIQSNQVVVPIGITSTYSGEVKLTVSGMNNYDAKIYFVDTEGIEEEITNVSEYVYTFNHNGNTSEGRFNLRFMRSSTGIDNNTITPVTAHVEGSDLLLISSGGNPINEVQVYDLQGRQLAKEIIAKTSVHRMNNAFTAPGVYVVKVYQEQGVSSIKVIR